MIQRIQTLFISVGIIAMVLTFLFPLATLTFEWKSLPSQMVMELVATSPSAESTLLPQDKISMLPLIILEVVIALIALVAIFLYKNRRLQLRVLAFAFLFTVIDLGAMFWFVDRLSSRLTEDYGTLVQDTYGGAVYMPMFAIFAFLLAQRAIRKDDALIRSSERIR